MAPLETYIAGDVWTAGITFDSNPDGSPVDPSTVVFAYSIAGGDPVRFTYGSGGSPHIIRVGTGQYSISIDTSAFATAETGTQSVQYTWSSQGTPGQGVSEGVIQVNPPIIPLDFDPPDPIPLYDINNLDDVADAATSRTNLGLGTAATHNVGDFDAAGAATTAQTNAETYAAGLVSAEATARANADNLRAPIANPHLTGHPQAPTQPPDTNDEDIATTEFVQTALEGVSTEIDAAVLVETERAEAAEAAISAEIESGGISPIKFPVDLVSAYDSEVPDSPPHGLTYNIDTDVANTPGMRVLLTAQDNQVDNGLWVVSSGDWTRPTDWAHGATIPAGTLIYAQPFVGEFLGGSIWELQSDPIVVDTATPTFYAVFMPSAVGFFPQGPGLQFYTFIPLPVIGNADVSLFSYAGGNPNGVISSLDPGDILFSTHADFLGPWKALGEDAWVRAHTGPHSIDSGADSVALGDSGIAYSSDMTVVASTNAAENGVGTAQVSFVVAQAQTTDAGTSQLATCAGATILTLVDQNGDAVWDRTIRIHGTIVARRIDEPGTDSAWQCDGVLRGDGSSAYSWVGGSVPTWTVVAQDTAAAPWIVFMDVESNVVIGEVTGDTGEVNWECTLELHEVAGSGG